MRKVDPTAYSANIPSPHIKPEKVNLGNLPPITRVKPSSQVKPLVKQPSKQVKDTVKLKKRVLTKITFQLYKDQMIDIKKLRRKTLIEGDKEVSGVQIIRDAIDDYLQKKLK